MRKFCRSVDLQYERKVDWLQPDRYRHLYGLASEGKLSAQGAGLSIAACSIGEASTVINMQNFDRILSFDGETGIVEVEAGCTLAKLHQFLLPRGYWLAVQPGYPYLTIGGCIAGNVHGKNHYRDGCFDRQVISLKVYHPDFGELDVSHTQDSTVFDLTLGGFGLTGIIVSVFLQTQPINVNAIRLKHHPVNGLSETITVLSQLKNTNDILFSWNDLSRYDSRMGQGFVVSGTLEEHQSPTAPARQLWRIDPNRSKIPWPLLNRFTIPIANRLYGSFARRTKTRYCSLDAGIFPWLNKTFYFDSFGRKGVIEPQILVPDEQLPSMLQEFEALLRRYREPFAVASFKLFRGKRKLLRFDGSGVSFSLQIPATKSAKALCEELDSISTRHGAITNLIKDSRLPREVARAQYSEFDKFVKLLREIDPKRLFSNAMSERLGL